MRSVHGAETIEENLSGYYLADELSHVYRGMMIAIPGPYWRVCCQFEQTKRIEMLQALAAKMDLARFQKNRRGPKKPPPKRNHDKDKPHVSTARILASRRR